MPSTDDHACFAASMSTAPDVDAAVAEVCDQVCDRLTAPATLAVLFVSADRADDCERIVAEVEKRLGGADLLGCTGESIVGTAREVEGQTALSLWAAHLPATTVIPMHLWLEQAVEGSAIVGWPNEMPDPWPEGAALLVLGDPFSFPADALLARLNEDRPGVPVIGGMASGGTGPGENRLLFGGKVHREGAVAALLWGGLRVSTVVSQGCRPIGRHMVVTKADNNVIYELGGRPALIQLKEIFDQLPTREQELVQNGLHLGRVVSEYQETFQQGDFLVRNVMGIDPDKGAIAIGDFVRPGQTVQFHIRDQQTADDEFKQLLAAVRDDEAAQPAGGLMFTCNGRGTRLFTEPHHDAQAVQAALGDIPLAGFFAAGELGPVAGRNFMHGFTASVALFEPAAG